MFRAINITTGSTSKAAMVPGTYYYDSGASRLYIRTYEGDNPDSHAIEGIVYNSSAYYASFYINNQDYITLEGFKLTKGGMAGLRVNASTAVINNITVNSCLIYDNDIGIAGKGSYAKTINVNNCDIVRNGASSLTGDNNSNTTINATNCIFGGNIGLVSRPYPTCTFNLTNCILAGVPRGRYWLQDGVTDNSAGGTTNYTNCQYKDPQFVSGGGNGLGVVTLGVDDVALTGAAGNPNYTSMANVISSYGGKLSWQVTSVSNSSRSHSWLSGQSYYNSEFWQEANTLLAAGKVVIGAHTRNHPNMATVAHGADITNVIYVNYAGACTTATVAFDPVTHLLTTSIDGSAGLSIDITNSNLGGYDLTYLGDATHGLIGYISHQANYSAGWVTSPIEVYYPADVVSPYTPNYFLSSTIIDSQSGVNIKATNGSLAMDSEKLYDTELYSTTQTGGMLSDFALQDAPIKTWVPYIYTCPGYTWSEAGVARLYARSFKAGMSGDYYASAQPVLRAFLGHMYPYAQPIIFPGTSEHLTLVTNADGVAEAENVSACLSMWPMTWNLYSDNGYAADALTGFFSTIYNRGIKISDIGQVIDDNKASGAVLNTTNYRLTRKIVPIFDFHLKSTSPCINNGTPIVGLTNDSDGKHVPNGPYPDIGAYEFYQKGIFKYIDRQRRR
jgi:hypothetical protein